MVLDGSDPASRSSAPDGSDPASRSSPPIAVSLLGPVRLTVDGAAVAVPGRLRLAVLALLALAEGRAVPASTLIDALWPEDPPPTGVSALHSHISRLRGHLGPAAGRLRRYEACVRAARYARTSSTWPAPVGSPARSPTCCDSDPRRAAELGAEALGLWRGTALDEFADMPPLAAAAVGLDELRRRLVDDQLQAEIDGGTPGVSAHAATVAVADPLRERTVLSCMPGARRRGSSGRGARGGGTVPPAARR